MHAHKISTAQKVLIVIVGYILSTSPLFSSDIQFPNSNSMNKKRIDIESTYPGYCTIFSISKGEFVFFGNNEDWRNPNTYCWVEQASDSTYGVIYLGFEDFFPQGGINEKGLAFDANALPGIKLKEHRELLKPYQAIVNTYIMQKCATVKEAIEMAKSYDWSQSFGGILRGQFLLADATGDAVVISSDQNGEIVFTRKKGGDAYLVSTNFNIAYPENKFGSGKCRRYDTASKMLGSLLKEENISVNLLADILNAVHEEGKDINTLYSNIFDLKKGIIYLYHWHQFDQVAIINVSNWIGLNPEPKPIVSFFNENTIQRAKIEYSRHRKKSLFIIIPTILTALAVVIYIKKHKLN